MVVSAKTERNLVEEEMEKEKWEWVPCYSVHQS